MNFHLPCKNFSKFGLGIILSLLATSCRSASNAILLTTESPKISDQPVELYIIKDAYNGLGFIDRAGNMIDLPELSDAQPFRQGLAAAEIKNEQKGYNWGFINHLGKFVIEPKYTGVIGQGFSDSRKAVVLSADYKHLIIDQTGKETPIPKGLRVTTPFKNGLAVVADQTSQLGLINESGDLVVEPQFAQIHNSGSSLLRVQLKSQKNPNYINSSGELLFDSTALDPSPLYPAATNFSEDRAIVKFTEEDKYLLIDSSKQVIKEFKVSEVFSNFTRPRCSTEQGYSQGLISAGFLPEGVNPNSARSVKQHKCGYLDRNGDVAIEPKFDLAKPFSEGLAAVQVNGKWGFINPEGEMVIEPKYNRANPFQNGLALVASYPEKYFGYIDTKGKVVYKSQ